MIKYTIKLTILLTLFSVLSCEKTETNNTVKKNEYALKSTAPTMLEIASYYAPDIVQDVDVTDGWCSGHSKTGSADWITPVNYDYDWIAYNNWDNLENGRSNGTLKGQVYYNNSATSTHWYILYSIYHPRDWSDILCGIDEHENDLEGVLICASRGIDGNSYGDVEYMSTIYHTEKLTYEKNEIIFNGNRPIIFIEAKGHGIKAYSGNKDKDNSYIEYTYGGTVTQPLKNAGDLPQNCNYGLLSLKDELFSRLNNTDLFDDESSFKGDNYNENAANTPWAWGDICNSPAEFIEDALSLSNFDVTYKYRDIEY